MKNILSTLIVIICLTACQEPIKEPNAQSVAKEIIELPSVASQIAQLKADGFQTFDYIDETTGDTIIMQQYFMAFLKSGTEGNYTKVQTDSLQTLHLAHLGRMYEEGYADISGPMGDNSDLRGITIYNVPTLKIADSLAHLDPLVQSGRLAIEIKPWWAGKGFPLR